MMMFTDERFISQNIRLQITHELFHVGNFYWHKLDDEDNNAYY